METNRKIIISLASLTAAGALFGPTLHRYVAKPLLDPTYTVERTLDDCIHRAVEADPSFVVGQVSVQRDKKLFEMDTITSAAATLHRPGLTDPKTFFGTPKIDLQNVGFKWSRARLAVTASKIGDDQLAVDGIETCPWVGSDPAAPCVKMETNGLISDGNLREFLQRVAGKILSPEAEKPVLRTNQCFWNVFGQSNTAFAANSLR